MLPSSWVDSLFARLAVRYGAEWLAKWKGIDMAAVKTDWATELGGYAANPKAIAHALEHLPDRPPTVSQFLALCRGMHDPGEQPKQLTTPKAKEESVQRAKELGVSIASKAGLQWARDLRQRERACARLTAAQRAMWREGLKFEMEAEASSA